MLAIRLMRVGRKKRAFYRVVAAERASARDSAAVEILGHYDPQANPERLVIDRERLAYYLGVGAQPSDTVRTLLVRHKAPVEPPAEPPPS